MVALRTRSPMEMRPVEYASCCPPCSRAGTPEVGCESELSEGDDEAGVKPGDAARMTDECTAGVADDRTARVTDECTRGVADDRTAGVADGCTARVADGCTRGVADDRTAGVADGCTARVADERTQGVADDCTGTVTGFTPEVGPSQLASSQSQEVAKSKVRAGR